MEVINYYLLLRDITTGLDVVAAIVLLANVLLLLLFSLDSTELSRGLYNFIYGPRHIGLNILRVLGIIAILFLAIAPSRTYYLGKAVEEAIRLEKIDSTYTSIRTSLENEWKWER